MYLVKITFKNVLNIQTTCLDKLLTSLPEPVVNVSVYLPGAPQGNEDERITYLSKMAMEYDCRLAKTMTLENCHEIAKMATNKTKAAFCNVTPKGKLYYKNP